MIDEYGKDNTWIGRNFAYKPVIIRGNYNLGQEIDVEIKDAGSFDLRADTLNGYETLGNTESNFT